MNTTKWLHNGTYLTITLLTFALSLLKSDNSVWIAAWIAPVFMIRFMRHNKWGFAVIAGFIALQLADFLGSLPLLSMYFSAASMSDQVDFMFLLLWQVKSGALFFVPSLLVPFLVDKALYKKLPKFTATLIYPGAVVAFELLFSLTTGVSSFAGSQFAVQPLVMTCSLFGVFGLSFLLAWFASMINYLWQENWNIKNLGYSGLVYAAIMAAMLLYGGVALAFPEKADKSVPIAGITTNIYLEERVIDSGLSFFEVSKLSPADYAKVMSSPQSHVDDIRHKTRQAVKHGAKIIIWQETSLMLESSVADALLLEMKNLADKEDVYILVAYERLFNDKEKKDKPMQNTGVLFTPEGKKAWEYTKAFPIPGFEDYMVNAGPQDIPYLDTPYGRLGQVICFDSAFPHYIRQAAEKNIDLLLIPAWDTVAHTPRVSFTSAYRAVENGFTMIRIAGDGHSAVIDPYYRQWAGQNTFDQGARNFYANVPVLSTNTFYAAFGFIFPYAVVLLLLSLILLAIIRAVIIKSAK
ncbi:MAG: carbon-nitrogen hydrolase family protein [Spirochaetales bacterium]|nr:carbon-nitrogen hydrolase family protein [Spirochaetales bacterium]